MIPRASKATLLATGVLILAFTPHLLAAQRPAPAQRGGPPRPDTPQLLVSVLASSDPKLGLAASDAIGKRIQDEHRATDLYVVPNNEVRATLMASGYNPDSTLSTSDLLELTRRMRSDYAIQGTVERTTSGVTTSIRLIAERGQTVVAEPLAPIVGTDFGEIAKQVDHAVSEALRALAFNRTCVSALATGDYAKAVAEAAEGLKIRPTSPALNLCVLRALVATHARSDSVIAIASAIVKVDSESVIAWASLADAAAQMHDAASALGATRVLHRLQPTNVAVTTSFVEQLVAAGQPGSALAVLDTAIQASPGAPQLLRQRWLLQLRLGQFANAIESGKALVAADSTAATVDYFERQLAAAQSAHDTASVRALATDALARFPRNVEFLMLRARDAIDENKAADALGLLDRVLAIDSTNVVAWQFTITARAKANGTDSAIVTARRALAAGVARDAVGESLVTSVAPSISAAQASQKRQDWEVVLRAAQTVDSVAPSPRSAFYTGIAAYQVASDEAQVLVTMMSKRTPTPAERQAACTSATRIDELARTITIVLPRGGRVEPAIAARILTALPGIADYASSVKQARCRPREQ